MKKIIYMLLALTVLSGCGPHRMKCGARGICETPKKISDKPA